MIGHFPSKHRLAFEDTVNTVITMITFVVSRGSHARQLSRRSRTSSLEAVTYVVSRGDHVRRLSRQSRTLSLETIIYVVSRGDHVRLLSRRSRTSSLEVVTYVVSRVELAPEAWLRDAGTLNTVYAFRVYKDL